MSVNDRIWNRNFVCMFLAYFGIIASYMIHIPTIPIFLRDLGYPQDLIGLLTGLFAVTAILSRPFVGRKLDTGDRRTIFAVGSLITFLASASYLFLDNPYALTAMRLIHGIGLGITTSSANTIATDFIPPKRMGEGIGYFSLCTVIGLMAAPALGLFLTERVGVEGAFIAAAAGTFAGFALSFLIRYSPEQKAAFREMAAANRTRKLAWSDVLERRALRPSTTMLLAGATHNAISSFLALYAESRGVANIGLYFTVSACTLFFSRIFAGRITDRKGYSFVVVPGLALGATAVFLLYLANSLIHFLLIAVLFALSFGSAQTALHAMAVTSVPANRRGAAVGTLFTGLDLSILLGSSLAGMLAGMFGYDLMMLMLVGPMLLSLAVYFAFGKWDRPRREPHAAQ